jgi:hypothetical protein
MPGETIGNIGHQFNYDNVYFRMVTVALAKTINKSIRWINYFGDEKRCITVPITNRMFGQERFLLDSFVDDITDTRVELNTDMVPRGVLSLTSFSPVSDEFANPNIYIPKETKIHDELKRIVTKVKAVPMKFSFDVEIHLDNVRDVYMCSEKINYLLFNYYFFSMDYFGMNIPLVLELPDDKTVEIPTEGDLTSDKKKTIKFSLSVRGNYPIWKVDTDNVECYNEEFENIKRVYWQAYVHDYEKLRERTVPENVSDPTYQQSDPRQTTSKEDFTGRSFTVGNPNYDKLGT